MSYVHWFMFFFLQNFHQGFTINILLQFAFSPIVHYFLLFFFERENNYREGEKKRVLVLFAFSSKTSGVFAIVLLDYPGSSDPK